MRFATLVLLGGIWTLSTTLCTAARRLSFSGLAHLEEPAVKIVTPSAELRVPELMREVRANKVPRLPDLLYLCGGGVVQVPGTQVNGLGDEATERIGQCMLSCKLLEILLPRHGVDIALPDNAGIVGCFAAVCDLVGLSEDDELYGEFVDPDEIQAFKKQVRFENDYTLIFQGDRRAVVEIDLMHDRTFVSIEKSYACYRFERAKEARLEEPILKAIAIQPNQSLEPMARSVTSRAGARDAPALTMAHH